MEITLELHTEDPESVTSALLGGNPSIGDETSLADDLSLRYLGTETNKALDVITLVLFALSIPAAIASNIVADLIIKRLQPTTTAKITRAVLEITEEIQTTAPDGRQTIRRQTRREEIVLGPVPSPQDQ